MPSLLGGKSHRKDSIAAHPKGPATGGTFVELPPLEPNTDTNAPSFPLITGSGSSSKILYQLGAPVTLSNNSGNNAINGTRKSSTSSGGGPSSPPPSSSKPTPRSATARRPSSFGDLTNLPISEDGGPISPSRPSSRRKRSASGSEGPSSHHRPSVTSSNGGSLSGPSSGSGGSSSGGGFFSGIRRGSNFVYNGHKDSSSSISSDSPPRKKSSVPSLLSQRHPSGLSTDSFPSASTASSISLATPPSSAPASSNNFPSPSRAYPDNSGFPFSPDYTLDVDRALVSDGPPTSFSRSISDRSFNSSSKSLHKSRSRTTTTDSIHSTPTLKGHKHSHSSGANTTTPWSHGEVDDVMDGPSVGRHTSTDDGPIEEIVPWMFEKSSSSTADVRHLYSL